MAKPINKALLEVYNPLYEENNLLRLAIEDLMWEIVEQATITIPWLLDITINNSSTMEQMSGQLFSVYQYIQNRLEAVPIPIVLMNKQTTNKPIPMVKRKYAPSNNYKDMELELPTTHKWKPRT
jgi:hypothetical protein